MDEKLTLTCPTHGETWAINHLGVSVCDQCYVEYRFRERELSAVYVERSNYNDPREHKRSSPRDTTNSG